MIEKKGIMIKKENLETVYPEDVCEMAECYCPNCNNCEFVPTEDRKEIVMYCTFCETTFLLDLS